MYKLVFCCVLFIGFLNPLLSHPVPDSREGSLQLLGKLLLSLPCVAAAADARSALDELERLALLQMLLETSGAETGDGLQKADLSINIVNPRGSMEKFRAFSGQDPNILRSHLLARIRKQYKKRGSPPECFWKYCV
ncbi:urotensin-2 [Diceros bicornis minor]|uniref:urotensin-2 n=1 Tax=Diceros bicornis minor TaxID=77932 RepID=UPI0026F0D4CB|nr:urotensin-2 [Diceros bicornis minor]